MLWWQILLAVILSIASGLLMGLTISYIILRIKERRFIRRQRLLRNYEASRLTQEQVNPAIPTGLFDEIEINCEIASSAQFSEKGLFQTEVWDSRQDSVINLATDVRDDLLIAYNAMNYANSIVLLATDLGRYSEYSGNHYVQLCEKISARLQRVRNSLK